MNMTAEAELLLDVPAILDEAAGIEGMMLPESAAIWCVMLETQHDTWAFDGLASGDYVEIGTFKGKSASILANFNRAYGNWLAVVDPVIDPATRERLLGISPRVGFYEMRSEYLRVSELYRERFRSCAFVHIDGMHTFSAVADDLRHAEDMLGDFGIVCIDDFHTNLYPQIPAAVYRHLYSGGSDLSMFLVGFNKAYLCRNAAKRFYHACVRDNFVHRLRAIGYDLTLIKTDRHDLFDAFAVDRVDPAIAGDPHR